MKFREIIVKNINLEEGTYTSNQDEIKTFEPLYIYLVPKKGGLHDRFVTDSEGVISKQSIESNDTFDHVTNRGNTTTKNEIILASAKDRAAAIGFNETSYSYYFGDMNPEHTGSHNISMGFNTLGKLTSGAYNTSMGGYSLSALTDGTYNTTLGYATAYKLNKSSSNVFIGQYTGFNLTGEVGESDLMNTSPSAAGYLKEMAYYSGYNGTSFHSSFNTFVGATINSTPYSPVRAAMSTIIGASTLNNSLYRNFNNIIVGAGNYLTTANSSMNNSIIIGNCINLPNQKDSLAIGLNKSRRIHASEAIIYAHLPNDRLYINAPLTIPSQYMPNAQGDGTFTKNIVAKSDGSFGWEDKMEGIPLTGTTSAGKNVTGAITYEAPTIFTSKWEELEPKSYAYLSQDEGLYQSRNDISAQLQPHSLNIQDYKTSGASLEMNVHQGIKADKQYPPQNPNYYIQKGYIDEKLSYSNQEQLTGGEWVDGKPIYKRTIKFENIPSHGEISLATEFGDIEAIVSNQMFTEWYAMDVAFAGNQHRGKAFITLQPEMVKIEHIPNEDYDYSLIDSFTLTLEYTKK